VSRYFVRLGPAALRDISASGGGAMNAVPQKFPVNDRFMRSHPKYFRKSKLLGAIRRFEQRAAAGDFPRRRGSPTHSSCANRPRQSGKIFFRKKNRNGTAAVLAHCGQRQLANRLEPNASRDDSIFLHPAGLRKSKDNNRLCGSRSHDGDSLWAICENH